MFISKTEGNESKFTTGLHKASGIRQPILTSTPPSNLSLPKTDAMFPELTTEPAGGQASHLGSLLPRRKAQPGRELLRAAASGLVGPSLATQSQFVLTTDSETSLLDTRAGRKKE